MSNVGEFEEQSSWGFETRAVHTGQEPDPVTGAVVTPISLSTTFAQDGVGGHKGFEYSRSGNPTRAALGDVRRLAGGWPPRIGVRQRTGRGGQRAAAAERRRPGVARQRRLRRDVPADLQGAHVVEVDGGRPHRYGSTRCRLARRHQAGVARDADQSVAALLRHREDLRDRPQPRRDGVRRQHVRHSVPAATADAWAPTSWCTRPPSTSAVTATWSADSWRSPTTSWRAG